MVALEALEVIAVPVVVGIQPLGGFVCKGIGTVLHPPSAVGIRPTVTVVIGAAFSVTVALGAIFLDELITSAYAIGGLIILIGVILVVSVERIKKEPAV